MSKGNKPNKPVEKPAEKPTAEKPAIAVIGD